MQVVMKFEEMVGIEDTETTRQSLCILRGSRRESGSLSRPLVRNNENKERWARSGDNVKCVLRRRTAAGQNAVLKIEDEGAYWESSIAPALKRLVDLFERTKLSHLPLFSHHLKTEVPHSFGLLSRKAMRSGCLTARPCMCQAGHSRASSQAG